VATEVIPVTVVVDEKTAVAVEVVVNTVEVEAVINEEGAEASKAKAVVVDVMTGTIVVLSVRK